MSERKPSARERGVTVDSYLGELGDWRREAAERIRAIVREAAPDADEAIRWAQPVWSSNGPFAYLRAHARHLNLGFWRGAELPDPSGRLAGGGERMAHVKITGPDDVRPDEIAAWVRAAVKLNAERGTPTRRG